MRPQVLTYEIIALSLAMFRSTFRTPQVRVDLNLLIPRTRLAGMEVVELHLKRAGFCVSRGGDYTYGR